MTTWQTARPCKVCGHSKRCSVAPDGRHICRTPEAWPHGAQVRTDRGGEEYFIEPRDGALPTAEPMPEAWSETPTTDDVHDLVYRALLEHLPLSAEHLEALRKRGLTGEEIEHGMFRTMPSEDGIAQRATREAKKSSGRKYLADIRGFARGSGKVDRFHCNAGVIIPVFNAKRQIVALRVRVDDPGDGGKYRWVSAPSGTMGCGCAARAYAPPLDADATTVVVVEGEFKALVGAARTGRMHISIPGVTQWRTAIELLVSYNPTRVEIAFDADARTNPGVANALQRAAGGFSELVGPDNVGVAVWPEACGKGLDDVLVNGHGSSVEVKYGREAWEQIASLTASAGAKPDPLVEARATLADLPTIARQKPSTLFDEKVVHAAAMLQRHAKNEWLDLLGALQKARVKTREWNGTVTAALVNMLAKERLAERSEQARAWTSRVWEVALRAAGLLGDKIAAGHYYVRCPHGDDHRAVLLPGTHELYPGHPICTTCTSMKARGWLRAVDRDVIERACVEALDLVHADDYVMTRDGIFEASVARFGFDDSMDLKDASTLPGYPEPKGKPLANFRARIVEDRIYADGDIETHRTFMLEALVQRRARRIEVPSERFSGLEWVATQLGSEAVIHRGRDTRERVREAIQLCSMPVPEKRVHNLIGWQRVNGAWVYLHADGGIDATGARPDIEVITHGSLRLYRLPPPPDGDALTRAVRACMELFALEPAPLTVPVFTQTWRAPLGPSSASLMLAATQNSGKTTLAAIGAAHFGPEIDANHTPVYLPHATKASVNHARSIAGDVLFLADDFLYTGRLKDNTRMVDILDSAVRSQHAGAGTMRLSRDARQIHQERPPRGQLLLTGELLPPGHSLRSRLLMLELGGRLPCDLTVSMARAREGVYAQAMAALIRWLAPNLETHRARATTNAKAYAQRLELASERTRNMVGDLGAGWMLFAEFAAAVGAATAEELERLGERVLHALGSLGKAQGALIQEQDPTDRFLEVLRSAMRSGQCHIASARGGVPSSTELFGWQLVAGEHRPSGRRVGWVEDDHVWLDGEAALAVVCRVCTELNDGFPLNNAKTLSQRLHAANKLASTELKTRNTITVRRVIQGKRASGLLHMSLDAAGLVAGDDAQHVPPGSSWSGGVGNDHSPDQADEMF